MQYMPHSYNAQDNSSKYSLPLLPAVRSLRKKHPQKPDITAPLGLAPRLFLKLRRFDFYLEIPRGKATVDNA
jgi:hypothetical protein